MSSLIDNSLVGLVLLVSAVYAVMALGPRSLRQRLLTASATLLRCAPMIFGLRGIAQRLEDAAAAKAKGACGGCDNCGSDSTASEQAPAAEVRVPVTKIGRRT